MEEAVYALPQTQYDALVGASVAKRRRVAATTSSAVDTTTRNVDRSLVIAPLTMSEINTVQYLQK